MPELACTSRSYLNLLTLTLAVAGKRARHKLAGAIRAALASLALVLAVLFYLTWKLTERIDH